MELTEEEKSTIKQRLRRSNRKIWTDEVLPHVYEIINNIRTGRSDRQDWFIPGMVTFDDYIMQLNLIRFI